MNGLVVPFLLVLVLVMHRDTLPEADEGVSMSFEFLQRSMRRF